MCLDELQRILFPFLRGLGSCVVTYELIHKGSPVFLLFQPNIIAVGAVRCRHLKFQGLIHCGDPDFSKITSRAKAVSAQDIFQSVQTADKIFGCDDLFVHLKKSSLHFHIHPDITPGVFFNIKDILLRASEAIIYLSIPVKADMHRFLAPTGDQKLLQMLITGRLCT